VARLVDKGPHFGPNSVVLRSGTGCGEDSVSQQQAGPPVQRGPAQVSLVASVDDAILTDRPVSTRVDRWERRQRARERLQAQDRHRRIARMADELMPLWLYYSRRWVA
jgi:hypothetical protein